MEMETEIINAEWLIKQGFETTDNDNRHFVKRIGERICTIHQNPISWAWCFATFDNALRYRHNMFNNQGYPLRFKGELQRMVPTFFQNPKN